MINVIMICAALTQSTIEGLATTEEVVAEIESCFKDDRLYSNEAFISTMGEKAKRCHLAASALSICNDIKVKDRMEELTLECFERFDPYELRNSCGLSFRRYAVDRAMYLGSVLHATRRFKNPSPDVLRRIAKRLREIPYPGTQQEKENWRFSFDEKYRSTMNAIFGYRHAWLSWVNRELDILQRKNGSEKTKELAAELCDLMNADKEEREKVFKRFK